MGGAQSSQEVLYRNNIDLTTEEKNHSCEHKVGYFPDWFTRSRPLGEGDAWHTNCHRFVEPLTVVEKLKRCKVIPAIKNYYDGRPPPNILSQTWRPIVRKTLQDGDIATKIKDAFIATKTPGYMTAKKIPIKGTISETNITEIHRSISYSIYFNFSIHS